MHFFSPICLLDLKSKGYTHVDSMRVKEAA